MKKTVNSCGIDEVGRGALAGPLVVACVSFNTYNEIPHGIKDSKTLSLNKRNKLYKEIIEKSCIGISIINSGIIDDIGIEKSTEKAACESFKKIKKNLKHVYLDGTINLEIEANCYQIIKGDNNFVSIAAASIIAKCTRDKIMQDLSKNFSQYAWQRNVGYGTKEHLLAIEKYGITEHHRMSYEPVKSMVKINELQ